VQRVPLDYSELPWFGQPREFRVYARSREKASRILEIPPILEMLRQSFDVIQRRALSAQDRFGL
jgi:hypothetical protein